MSLATAAAMAAGALAHSRADWALAITGVAGPGGGSADKPVGLVCFAWAGGEGVLRVSTRRFAGGRAAVRGQAAAYALAGLLDALGCNGDDGRNGSGTNVAEAAGVMSA